MKCQELHRADAVRWQINTYRVLLARARFETIIFVPLGNAADQTRDPAEFDAIADFLRRWGAAPLDEQKVDTPAARLQPILV